MKKKFKLGVIGAGFMASSIVKGGIDTKIILPEDIIVSDISETSLDKISELGVNTTLDNNFLVENSNLVLIAIKPQGLNSLLDDIKFSGLDKCLSIMAGVKKEKIKKAFPNAKVARCMPNTPCSIGFGAIGLDLSDITDKADAEFIYNLLSALAQVVILPEDKLNAVTGVSGSSPAYFYMFIDAIIKSGIKHGLTEEEAKQLAVATMIGSGKMIERNADKSLEELISAVCSKGGTTVEAVNSFRKDGLYDIVDKGIDSCVKRAFELENL